MCLSDESDDWPIEELKPSHYWLIEFFPVSKKLSVMNDTGLRQVIDITVFFPFFGNMYLVSKVVEHFIYTNCFWKYIFKGKFLWFRQRLWVFKK